MVCGAPVIFPPGVSVKIYPHAAMLWRVLLLVGAAAALYKDSNVFELDSVLMEVRPGVHVYDNSALSGLHYANETLYVPYTESPAHRNHPSITSLMAATTLVFCVQEPPAVCGYTFPRTPGCAAHSPDCVCYNWRFAGVSNTSVAVGSADRMRPGCAVWTVGGESGTVDFEWDLQPEYPVLPPGAEQIVLESAKRPGRRSRKTRNPDHQLAELLCPANPVLAESAGCFARHTVKIEYLSLNETLAEEIVLATMRRSNREGTVRILILVAGILLTTGAIGALVWFLVLPHTPDTIDSEEDSESEAEDDDTPVASSTLRWRGD